MTSDGSGAGRGRPSKVARLIEEYDLGGLGDELEREWTKQGSDHRSLRELADDFNLELFERALSDAGVPTLAGEVENLYALLTSDEATGADRTRARRRLEREGVDVETLVEDFVSYQAIRTYLKNHRGATYELSDTDRIARAEETIEQLRNRLASVAESKLDRLAETEEITVGSPGVIVEVRGVCETCGYQFSLADIDDQLECDCADE